MDVGRLWGRRSPRDRETLRRSGWTPNAIESYRFALQYREEIPVAVVALSITHVLLEQRVRASRPMSRSSVPTLGNAWRCAWRIDSFANQPVARALPFGDGLSACETVYGEMQSDGSGLLAWWSAFAKTGWVLVAIAVVLAPQAGTIGRSCAISRWWPYGGQAVGFSPADGLL